MSNIMELTEYIEDIKIRQKVIILLENQESWIKEGKLKHKVDKPLSDFLDILYKRLDKVQKL